VFVATEKTTFHLKSWLKNYWFYLIIYAFFLYVSLTTARLGDDWEVSQWYRDGILSTLLGGGLFWINNLSGRIASLFFGSFFAYYDFLWCLIAPAVFTGIIYLSAKLFGYAHRFAPVILSLLMLLSVSNDIRMETYVWLVGNVGYIFVIVFIFLYINIIYSEGTNHKFKFWQHESLNHLIILLLAFFIGLWVETVTLGFIAANILLALFFYLRNKQVPCSLWYGIAGCILSDLVMFASPGRLATAQDMGLGVRQQILQNVSGIMQMLVIDNLSIYLLFFIVFIAAALWGEFSSRGKLFRIISIIFASLAAVIISARMILDFAATKWYWPLNNALNFINSTFFNVNRRNPVLICFAILTFILVIILFSPRREKLLVLYSIGMVSAGVMILSPYLGARVFVTAIIMLVAITAYLSSTIVIKSPDLRKAIFLALIFVTLLKIERSYYYGQYVQHTEELRLQLIENYRAQIADGTADQNGTLVLPAYKKDAVFLNANPGPNDFHMTPFKRYYRLPMDTKVIFDDGLTLKEFTITKLNGSTYLFQATPLRDDNYTYSYHVRKKGNLIFASPPSKDDFIFYQFPGNGTYTMSVVIALPSGDSKEIFADKTVRIRKK